MYAKRQGGCSKQKRERAAAVLLWEVENLQAQLRGAGASMQGENYKTVEDRLFLLENTRLL